MPNKLYVGSIAYQTTDDGLRQAFSAFGNVTSASVIMDKMTGRSKGFGFVEMSTAEEAQAAIQGLDGKELDGRTIRVNVAQPKEDRPRGGDRGGFRPRGGFGGGRGNY